MTTLLSIFSFVSGDLKWYLLAGGIVLAVIAAVVGFLFDKIKLWLLVGVVLAALAGGAYLGFEKIEADAVAQALQQQQIVTLQQTMKNMQDQITIIQKQETVANQTIAADHTKSVVAVKKIKSQNLNKEAQTNSAKLQTQINAQWTQTWVDFGNDSK